MGRSVLTECRLLGARSTLLRAMRSFYANFENDQGFFFSDLSGNELQELPFERIVIKRAQ